MSENFEALNNFQNRFFTNILEFNEYSNYEFKQFGYKLLNNLAKGYPNLANIFLNLKGINWNSAESPAILKALQRKFVNGFNKARIPQFVYFKNQKEEKTKTKIKESKHGFIFDSEIKSQICNIMFIDTKTYDYLQFGEKIQYLGQQLNGEFQQVEKAKVSRKKKPINL